MHLENYGSIRNIEHAYPLSKAHLYNEIDRFKATNWNNLRPMFFYKNISKGPKIDHRLYLMQEKKAKYYFEKVYSKYP